MTSGLIAESDIETSSCPLCGIFNSSPIHAFGRLNVVRCRECDLYYLSPRLKESILMSMYVSGTYFLQRDNAGYDDYTFQEKSLRITFRRFLGELLKRGMTGKRLLEVGSGYGYFLSEARSFFQNVSGIELSEEAASHARMLSGAEIHAGDLDTLPAERGLFDIIIAINVIEHIYEPFEFLRSAKKRLRGGGKIVLATPDIGSFWHTIMGKKWPSFKIPEHVAFYTRGTLTLLLERARFCNVRRVPFPHAFPAALVAGKFGINLTGTLSEKLIWLPKTMIALSAEVCDG